MGSSLSGSAAGDYFGKWAQIVEGNIIAVGSTQSGWGWNR